MARLANARHEMQFKDEYDFIVVSENLDEATRRICEILNGERLKAGANSSER